MADLLEIPSIALLVVSDNSATGAALVGRTEEEQRKYEKGRNIDLPKMIIEVPPWNEQGIKFWSSIGFREISRYMRLE